MQFTASKQNNGKLDIIKAILKENKKNKHTHPNQ